MEMRKYSLFIIPLVLVTHLTCRTSPDGPYSAASAESTFRGAATLMKSDPNVRFAVFDFADRSGSFTAYGKIIGDETSYRLSALKGIHLLERQKLSAILEEHGLEQSGLVSGRTREELGRLLPADIIVMGSYVFEGDRIKVNGRFTDVKTGEIRGTFVYYLGSPEKSAGGTGISDEEPASCEPYEKLMEPLMRDLRTPAMMEKVVRAAVKIPYTMKCRRIHQDIMSTFGRGGLYPDDYRQFLRSTVISIRDPEEVERKNSVFYYFQHDKTIDEMEWNTGILSMRNANERTVQRVVYFILNRGGSQDESLLLKRIDILMGLTASGAFGRPVTLTPDRMYQAILRVGSPNETTRTIRLYLLEKYAPRLPKDKRNLSYTLSYSEKSLISETDPAARKKFYNHIGSIFSSADPEDKADLALQLTGFVREMHYRHGKDDAPELRALSLSLSPWFCYAAANIRKDYRLQSAIGILKKYAIKCGQ